MIIMEIQTFSNAINERMNFLRNVSIFSQTEESILYKIAEVLSEKAYVAEQNIFKKGDTGDAMYIIVDGEVRIHDEDYTFAILKKGQVFGEYSLLDTEERSASVTTVSQVKLLVLEQNSFYSILLNNLEIVKGILRVLVERSRMNNRLQEELDRQKKMVEQQNDEIKLRNEEILAQNEEIIQQQEQIAAQNEALTEKNSYITASINYAQSIQQALLPKEEDITQILPDSFIYLQPKDIVSGDFYWLTQKEVSDGTKRTIVAAVDCTGHGVPGAFMSSLGTSYLNQIVDFQGYTRPDEILERLNQRIRAALNQDETNNQDGMDITLCVIDYSNMRVEYAGARNSLIYIQDNQFFEIKGEKFSIGGYKDNYIKEFTTHIIPIDQPTVFYLFSDGYKDQFGFETDKKFTSKRLRELLMNIYYKDMDEQRLIVSKVFEEWRGQATQTDDVLMIGFKI